MTKPKYREASAIFSTQYNPLFSEQVAMIEIQALTDLQEQCDRLETALEVYAMVNETFPEYGEAAIKTLAEYRKWKNQE